MFTRTIINFPLEAIGDEKSKARLSMTGGRRSNFSLYLTLYDYYNSVRFSLLASERCSHFLFPTPKPISVSIKAIFIIISSDFNLLPHWIAREHFPIRQIKALGHEIWRRSCRREFNICQHLKSARCACSFIARPTSSLHIAEHFIFNKWNLLATNFKCLKLEKNSRDEAIGACGAIEAAIAIDKRQKLELRWPHGKLCLFVFVNAKQHELLHLTSHALEREICIIWLWDWIDLFEFASKGTFELTKAFVLSWGVQRAFSVIARANNWKSSSCAFCQKLFLLKLFPLQLHFFMFCEPAWLVNFLVKMKASQLDVASLVVPEKVAHKVCSRSWDKLRLFTQIFSFHLIKECTRIEENYSSVLMADTDTV